MAIHGYMPLYVSDYKGDTAHLTTEQHGAYLLLLMTYWQRGKPLSDNDGELARIAGLTDERWLNVRSTIVQFFDVEDGFWRQKRVEHQLGIFRNKVSKARASGLASARAREKAPKKPTPPKRSPKPTNVQRSFNERSTDAERMSNSQPNPYLYDLSPSERGEEAALATASAPRSPPNDGKNKTKGTVLPAGWTLSESGRAYAQEHGFQGERLANLEEKFRNYWHAKAGADALKRDWTATWKNWVLKEVEGYGSPPAHAGSRAPSKPTSLLTAMLQMETGNGQAAEHDYHAGPTIDAVAENGVDETVSHHEWPAIPSR